MRAYLQIAALVVIATTLAAGNSSADPAPPSIGVAAFAADRAGNYAEALRLFRIIDAQSDAAFAGEASVDYFTAQRMGRGAQNYHFQAYHFLSTRSGAREKIGEYYEKGLGGVNQDYRTAAIYYAKATDKSNGDAPSIRATLRHAFLYATGWVYPGIGQRPENCSYRPVPAPRLTSFCWIITCCLGAWRMLPLLFFKPPLP